FFQAEDGIRDFHVTGVQTCALPILRPIVRLVRQYNSTLHIIHVGTERDLDINQQKNLEKYRNNLSEYDTEFHFIPKKANISKTRSEERRVGKECRSQGAPTP